MFQYKTKAVVGKCNYFKMKRVTNIMKIKCPLLLFLFILFLKLNSMNFVSIETDDIEIPNFFVMTTPITQNHFEEIMGYNNSCFQGDSLPVENVSWYEAIVFCNLLSDKHNLIPVYMLKGSKDIYTWGEIPNHRIREWIIIDADPLADGYRLLSQIEWDHIYKKITEVDSFTLEDHAWIHTNSDKKTHSVSQKKVDILGLYDFLGNVKEWVFDDKSVITDEYYANQNKTKQIFYDNLSFDIFRRSDFIETKDIYGFIRVAKSPLIGFRIARN